MEFSLPEVDEHSELKADSVSNLAKADHAQLQYMKLSPLREISTQGGKKGMKMLMMSQCLKITEKVSFNIEKPKACI